MIISDLYLILQEKELKLPIHRSRSVPVLYKEGSSPVRGVFRIVPTTLRLDEKVTTTPMTSPIHEIGNIPFSQLFYERYVNLRIFNNVLLILTKLNYMLHRDGLNFVG